MKVLGVGKSLVLAGSKSASWQCGLGFLTNASSSLVYVLDENEVDEDLKVIFKVS